MPTFTATQLARQIDADLRGDGNVQVSGLGALQSAQPGDLSHLSNPHYRRHLAGTRASAVLLQQADADECPCTALVVADPYAAYAQLSHLFATEPVVPAGIHGSAVVAPSARIAASANIGPHVVIGEDVVIAADVSIGAHCVLSDRAEIGAGSRLWPCVSVYHDVKIGQRCIIHSHAVLGADGFGFARARNGSQIKIAQVGGLAIGDDVEVGASTTIDRGAIEPTRIGSGVKIDNQVQIGHNCVIGDHSVICGCVGIVGSTRIGKFCVIAGGVGVGGGAPIEIADRVVVSGMTHVSQSILSPGVYSGGVLFEPTQDWKRNALRLKQLDDMAKRLTLLERRIEQNNQLRKS